ncbi:MAG: RNA-binding cell elongation regulator Jag/EloR [Desulfobacterales bacterium]
MKEPLEFVGKSIEKAATAACKKLGIAREKLQYKVISYGSTGIFGLVGSKKAKIVVVMPGAVQTQKAARGGSKPKAKEKQRKTSAKAAPRPTEVKATTPAPTAMETQKKQEGDSDPKALGLDFLQRVTGLISDNVTLSVEEDPEGLLFEIESSEAAILIGKRGKTLEAIQYLTEKIISKDNESRVHIQVDIEGYQKKRKDSLEALADRMAEKADRTGKPATIGQMSAYERKIVHLKLKEDSRVRTQSKGDGFLRKLVIIPVRNSDKEKAE